MKEKIEFEARRLFELNGGSSERSGEVEPCGACGGAGYTVESRAGCCGNATSTGECCGNHIEEQCQEGCGACEGTGIEAMGQPLPQGMTDESIEAALLAFNKEKSAQTGEPFYREWWEEFKRECPVEFSEEMAQMRCALRAAMKAGA